MTQIFHSIGAKIARRLIATTTKIFPYTFPPTVRVETTNACNARCVTCPRDKMTRKVGVMEFALFKKIIDECTQHKIHSLHLHNFGEPLLDKRLFDKIRYAKQRGIANVKIFTNLSLLEDEKARLLIQSGLDELKVSVDGNSAYTFESIRRGLNFNEVMANLQLLIDLKTHLESKLPKVKLVFVETPQNRGEKTSFLHRWQGKVDKVLIASYHNWADSHDEGSSSSAKGPKRQKLMPCLRIWQTFTILWDGRVALCCLDFDGKQILGDVNKEKIEQIYNGGALNQIRQWHLRGEFYKIPICEHCTARK